MKFAERRITLKDGRTCIVRNGTEQDAEGVLKTLTMPMPRRNS